MEYQIESFIDVDGLSVQRVVFNIPNHDVQVLKYGDNMKWFAVKFDDWVDSMNMTELKHFLAKIRRLA